MDPPPPAVVAAFSTSGAERGYPPSIGSVDFRRAVARWIERRFDVAVPIGAIGACIGSKEFVGTLPQWLRLRSPDRDTVLYPATSYPTYEMGAILAGCRPRAGADAGRSAASTSTPSMPADADRALVLWVNSPGNPTGGVDDLAAVAAWGRAHGVPVFSDECYVEFTWDGPARSVLQHGLEGVVAVHSLSKRSNLAGGRIGFYAGDPDLVHYLQEVRKHVGMMVPGSGAGRRLGRPRRRRTRRRAARPVPPPPRAHGRRSSGRGRGGRSPSRPVGSTSGSPSATGGRSPSAWPPRVGRSSARGSSTAPAAADHVRVAVVQPDERIELVAERLGV